MLLSLFFLAKKASSLFLLFHLKLCKFPEITTDCTEITPHFSHPAALEDPRTNWELFPLLYQITTVLFSFYPKGSQNSTYSHNLSSRMFALCLTASRSRLVPNDISVYPSRDPSLLSRYWLILSDDGKEGSSSQQVWLRRERSICYGWCGRPRILLNIDHLDFLVCLKVEEQSCETKAYHSNRNSD